MVERPVRVAIVGAGPAGLYAAGHLLEHEAGTFLGGRLVRMVSDPVEVDMFERLATPWGLVRSGVAPDHPNKKLVSRVFDAVAQRRGFRFFGNVSVGDDVSVSDLRRWYDAVIIAVGAASDRSLNIPGEHLKGSWSARQFVGWYNGHPDFRHLDFDLTGENVAVIGNGNVALDVARVLLADTGSLGRTDIADHALTALQNSNVRQVFILGRRGPAESAFNYAEFEELGRLSGVDIDIEVPPGATAVSTDWHVMRKVALIDDVRRQPMRGHPKVIRLRYLTSPVEVVGDAAVTGLRVARTPDQGGAMLPIPPESTSVLHCSNVIRAVGYECTAVAGLPFDTTRRLVANDRGRVTSDGQPMPGLYVTGWIKRGPRGVIGTNKKCARETVQCLLDDLRVGHLSTGNAVDGSAISDMLAQRNLRPVTYADWRRIDRHERGIARAVGRPRIKLTDRAELLDVAHRADTSDGRSREPTTRTAPA